MRNPWYWVGVIVLVILVVWLILAVTPLGGRDHDGRHGNDWEQHPAGSVA